MRVIAPSLGCLALLWACGNPDRQTAESLADVPATSTQTTPAVCIGVIINRYRCDRDGRDFNLRTASH